MVTFDESNAGTSPVPARFLFTQPVMGSVQSSFQLGSVLDASHQAGEVSFLSCGFTVSRALGQIYSVEVALNRLFAKGNNVSNSLIQENAASTKLQLKACIFTHNVAGVSDLV